jgi:hypothetical protein
MGVQPDTGEAVKCQLAYALIGALFALACDGEKIDAGDDEHDAGDHADLLRGNRLDGPVSNSFGIDCVGPIQVEYRGVFEGEFESHAFPSGSKKLSVNVQGRGANGICGTIKFGEGEAPAEATDPAAPYAPGLPEDPAYYERSTLSRAIFIEGFSYEFGRSGLASPPFPALPDPDPTRDMGPKDITKAQPYKAWCNLQTAYPSPPNYPGVNGTIYNCVPWGVSVGLEGCYVSPYDDPDTKFDVSCTQLTLCPIFASFCTCAEVGCTVAAFFGPSEFYFDGDELSGNIDLDDDPGIDTRSAFVLQRVTP